MATKKAAAEYRLEDVYGMARRKVPLTYVERDDVDARFINELGRDNHIVIYGSSKQGKSSLLLATLDAGDSITVQCATNWSKEKLYAAVLKKAGVAIIESATRSTGRTNEVSGEVEGEIGLSVLARIRSKISGKTSEDSQEATTFKEIPLDISSASDVIDLLEEIEFTKWIVIEDFHYLSVEVQKEFAGDLKAFYERSPVSFIIVGVWLEANRLIVYNGDLAHRLTSIPADTWHTDDLLRVVRAGEPLMNAEFSPEVAGGLVDRAHGNVGQLQEALRQMFLARGINRTVKDVVEFNDEGEVGAAYEYVAEQLAGRYANSINKFSEGLRDQKLHMYKWIMQSVIFATSEDRRAGLKAMDIVRHIQEHHPETLFPNNVHAALANVGKVQNHAEITPIILDFDLTHKRLTVVDNGFHVYLEGTPRDVALGYLAVFQNESGTEPPF